MSTDLNVSDILSLFNVPKIEERNYWLVRTDGGNYFEDFTRNNYIAIGWDYLTLERLGYKATV